MNYNKEDVEAPMDANTKDVLMIALPLVGTLVTGAISAWLAVKMAGVTHSVEAVKAKVGLVADDVLRVEKATNSHTDLLIEATKMAAHSEGMKQEQVEQLAREAEQAKGTAAQLAREAERARGTATQLQRQAVADAASTQMAAAKAQQVAAETQWDAAKVAEAAKPVKGPGEQIPPGSITP